MTDATPSSSADNDVTRRSVLRATAVGGLALPLLAACGSGTPDTAAPSPSAAAPSPQKRRKRKKAAPSPQAGALASTSQVPVGGGIVLGGKDVVLTQPKKGEFKAFSAICTHAGCQVGGVQQGVIVCPCHGSLFSITDGSVQGGPAPTPLPAVNISVQDGEIVQA